MDKLLVCGALATWRARRLHLALPGKRHITPPRGAEQPLRVHDKQHGQPQKAASAEKNLLSMAAAAGNIEAVDEVNRADEHGRTQLFIACGNGQVDAARSLLEKGAAVDRATKKYGMTPAREATSRW